MAGLLEKSRERRRKPRWLAGSVLKSATGRKGDAQRFVLYGKGIIGPLEEFEKRLLKRAKEETPYGFEMLVKRLLTAMGFEDVVKSRAVKDSGIDVRGTLVVGDVVRIRMAVQAKRFKGTVSSTLIQQLRGSLGAHEQGLVITTGRFNKQARQRPRVQTLPQSPSWPAGSWRCFSPSTRTPSASVTRLDHR